MDRGEIWWADLPDPVGRRPVLILTRSSAVASRNQIVVAQITRTAHHLPSEVVLRKNDGLPKDCFVNCDVLLTVPKTLLLQYVTKLSTPKMNQVQAALKFAMEIP
jgi:mRNA interferase MazF